jgi:hypothetical protein
MTHAAFLLVLAFLTSGCSNSKSGTRQSSEEQAEKQSEGWDYGKIRKAREAERLETPTPQPPGDENDCVVLSDAERKRARATGCRPLDPRLGHGEGMFCCDRL